MTIYKVQRDIKYIRNDDIFSTIIDGEAIMMSINNGHYYGVTEIAGDIWEWLKTPHSCQELCQHLQTEYEIDQENCEDDVGSFMYQLLQNNLINEANK